MDSIYHQQSKIPNAFQFGTDIIVGTGFYSGFAGGGGFANCDCQILDCTGSFLTAEALWGNDGMGHDCVGTCEGAATVDTWYWDDDGDGIVTVMMMMM